MTNFSDIRKVWNDNKRKEKENTGHRVPARQEKEGYALWSIIMKSREYDVVL